MNQRVYLSGGYEVNDVSSESITIPAGNAGDVVDFYFTTKPIADNNGGWVANASNTSISITAGDAVDTEVNEKDDDELGNGEYWVDYVKGIARGKKATSNTSITVDYKTFKPL